ncbi:MAG: hypothetical protein ACR2NZ_05385, partial [Rubripirellula sp.]
STLTNLPKEDGTATTIDLSIGIVGSVGGWSGANPTVVPSHVPSLLNLGGGRLSSDSINSIWSDLIPGNRYNIYVFAQEPFSDVAINNVMIQGEGAPESFVQNTTNKTGILFINAGEADAERSLESYAVAVNANSAGQIAVEVENPSTTPLANRVFLVGLGIQEAPPLPSGVTVTETDGTAVEEGGANDTYTIALDTQPTGAVEITIVADVETELSLNGTDFASQQVITLTDMAATTITVRAADDSDIEGTHVGRITASVTGSIVDPAYPASTYIAPVTVLIDDSDAVPPTVESVVVNGGDNPQRSRVDHVQVTFSQVVDINSVGGDPFQFTRVDDGTAVADISSVDNSSGKTVVSFTFDTSDDSVTSFGSLIDGDYRLLIDATRISSGGQPLDGDADNSAGGNYVYEGTDGFFRKFGDGDGDRQVGLLDFAAFRQTFGRANGDSQFRSEFDEDGDDVISLIDFAAFRRNYGS